MLDSRVQAIDVFYDKFKDLRPQEVASDLNCAYVYIHRLPGNEPVGIHARTNHRSPDRQSDSYFGYPKLESWLNTSYHPQIHLDTLRLTNGSVKIVGFVELFIIPLRVSPGTFDDPECSLTEVYNCAAAFTYEMMYNNHKPAISVVNKIIASGMKHNTPLTHIAEEASSIIDQKITGQYKSLTKAAQELHAYIRTKV